jgi:outer membrane protein TolC
MNKTLIIFFIGFSFASFSQEDSTKVLSYLVFMNIVMEHHPQVYQADIARDLGSATVKTAKGGFDPILGGNLQQKHFDGAKYYDMMSGALRIPTWFGLTAETGYETNDGAYLNPMDRRPSNGLLYAGLRLELGKGLIIDQRRAELKKARLIEKSSDIERIILRNDLIFQASLAYYNWLKLTIQKQTYEEAVENAQIRFDGVVNMAIFGDRPFVDTVEANLQLQNRLFGYNKTVQELTNTEEKLELFLWLDGNVPLEVSGEPDLNEFERLSLQQNDISDERDSLIEQHPYIQNSLLKVNEKSIDLMLKKEQLKPQLTIKYNALNEPVGDNALGNYTPNNYAWGGTVSYPILTRKERGEVELAKLKLQDQQFNLLQAKNELNYKIAVANNNFQVMQKQLELLQKTMRYNQVLYSSERQLFDMGESSLFLLNIREKAFLDSQLDLVELKYKLVKTKFELEYTLLILDNN